MSNSSKEYIASLPISLSGFRDYHKDETILVCGCGISLNELTNPENFITIGVNDIGRKFDPTYLVILNPSRQFKNDRFRYVEQSRTKAIFTQLDLGIRHPHIVRFKLGQRGGTDLTDPCRLPYTRNSPYVALCLAMYMGAKKIGLIGVDFTDHHFFAKTGRHSLSHQFEQIDNEYRLLAEVCAGNGVELVNLSEQSQLTALTKMSMEVFNRQNKLTEFPSSNTVPLNIVSYATTPVAGVPPILARCINARTIHKARCVWARNDYGNGVVFDGDIEWNKQSAVAEATIAQADVVIVHNGKIDAGHAKLLAGKRIITMAHNYLWNVDQRFVKQGFPGAVVGQYQAALAEFSEWSIVPNPIPWWESGFQPGKKNARITICYTPSGKHERYPSGHRLYWHAKGYKTTMQVLERLSKVYPIQLNVIQAKQVSHLESLAMKREAHIVIDECVTGSYHRNSLEGLAAGCVVINGVGLLPGVCEAFIKCAGVKGDVPFVQTQLDQLEQVLTAFIESGAKDLEAQGMNNRKWMEKHWDFHKQWDLFWLPMLQQTQPVNLSWQGSSKLIGSDDKLELTKTSITSENMQGNVSVIIPHGGQERVQNLKTTLVNLSSCQGVGETIVVEMEKQPTFEADSSRYADKYIFIHSAGVFDRARSLNTGVALAKFDLLLWLDNDLLISREFLSRAVDEMLRRHLDYLIPFTSIRYLSQADSLAVIGGVRSPSDCTPIKVFCSKREVSGGAGVVKKQFVLDYGGMEESFRGWGGEDNAWIHKVGILGRWNATSLLDQHVYHLYHPGSGANGDGVNISGNPYYAENLTLLRSIRRIKNRKLFLQKFPPPSHQTCPWEKSRRIKIVANKAASMLSTSANLLTRVLWDLYQINVECDEQTFTEKKPGYEVFPEVMVLFGVDVALSFLLVPGYHAIFSKTLVIIEASSDLNEKQIDLLRQVALVVVLTKSENNNSLLIGGNCRQIIVEEGSTELALLKYLSLVIGAENFLVEKNRNSFL